MDVQVDGSEAPPRVLRCPACGELFDSVESLDAHLPAVVGVTKCRDPWTVPGDLWYLFYPVESSPHGSIVWSLAPGGHW